MACSCAAAGASGSERRQGKRGMLGVMSAFTHIACNPAAPAPAASRRRRRKACRWTPPLQAQPERRGDSDIVERAVDFLFGKGARADQEPFGLKRMSDKAYREQCVATTTEYAAPVSTDDPLMARIRPLLAQTRLEAAQLRLAYDAERDGWSAESFHSRVDTFGAAVVVARTRGGALCGGYNPRGWIGLGEDRDSLAAFLFTWPHGNADPDAQAIKLPKVGGAGLAVQDKAEAGPLFGAEGLKIALRRGDERAASSRLGTYYARLPGGGRSLFADGESGKRAELVSLQVYVEQGSPETWTLDGVVWKSMQG